jgi:hypothetical protein
VRGPDLIAWLRSEGLRIWLIATDGSLPELADEALLTLPPNAVVICRGPPRR